MYNRPTTETHWQLLSVANVSEQWRRPLFLSLLRTYIFFFVRREKDLGTTTRYRRRLREPRSEASSRTSVRDTSMVRKKEKKKEKTIQRRWQHMHLSRLAFVKLWELLQRRKHGSRQRAPYFIFCFRRARANDKKWMFIAKRHAKLVNFNESKKWFFLWKICWYCKKKMRFIFCSTLGELFGWNIRVLF